ncbi:MAG: alpha-galactosidase [candidate division KSB1 bacterium]|nr:alpha-galactosidase [candidate division KSB1 bacterium]MDZ7345427.1 alpha-galactosidase [candidate division KSB1 bacterium]
MKRRNEINRREFCRSLALSGALLPIGGTLDASPRKSAVIENEFFRVRFAPATGTFDIDRGGVPLLTRAVVQAETADGLRMMSAADYRFSVGIEQVRDAVGAGRRIVVKAADAAHRLDFRLHLTLYRGLAAAAIEAGCRNVSGKPMILKRLSPLAAGEESGGLHWPVSRILTNGQMYSDPGSLIDLKSVEEPIVSWWNLGLFDDYRREGLVCGYWRNQSALGKVRVEKQGSALSLIADSTLADGFVLPPGGEILSEPFAFLIGQNPYAALESFAAWMGRLNSARFESTVHGWCSWFYTFEQVSEEEVLRNAEFAARVLKPFGLEYIQIDEGYQRWHGEWEGNERFPNGMKWTADRIRAFGLKPGLWIAPFVISEPTEVFQKHPDWLLRHPDGRLKRVGPWPSEDSDWARSENPRRYCLDITHPQAAEWLYDLFDTVANRWGYEMIKVDFVGWSLLSAERYYDPSISPAMAYRRAFEIMRKAAGPHCHLQDCGPGPVTVGLIDSMRIELDQNYGFRSNAWRQYVSTTGSAAAVAKRWYFHKRTWINDADHLCLGLLSYSQAQAVATIIALSGGNVISGDRLTDLDPTRLEILKKALPAYGETARAADLLDRDPARIQVLPIKRPFGEWTIAAFFNDDETDCCSYTLPMERLFLDNNKTYLAFDFWREAFFGEVKGELTVLVPPTGVTLLALHEKRGVPQVIGTDRHILQGAVELEKVHWDESAQALQGVSTAPAGSEHNVFIYLPQAHPWTQGGIFLHRDQGDCTFKMMDEHILRLHLRFGRNERIEWQVKNGEY